MNEALEALNGAWAILAGFAVFFTALHLSAVVRWGDKSLREHLRDLGFQLAISTAVICAGVGLSRAAVWYWRWTTGGDLSQLTKQSIPLGLGAVIGSVGFLLYIRVVTRPFGVAPTLMAMLAVSMYLATFLF